MPKVASFILDCAGGFLVFKVVLLYLVITQEGTTYLFTILIYLEMFDSYFCE